MAGSAASCVKDVINRSPFISEMLIQEVISFSNLASFIKPKVEQLYGGEVSNASIVMAIRRYAQDLKKQNKVSDGGRKIDYELSMKTSIYDVNIARSKAFIESLPDLYDQVHPESGDFLNVSIGEHEIVVTVSDKHRALIDEMVKKEKVIARESDMVALTIVFKDNFLETPGITYLATRKLAWENINIFEIVSTLKVLTFIIRRTDSLRADGVLLTFLDEEL